MSVSKTHKHIIRWFLLLLFSAAVLLLLPPYLQVENLTKEYGTEFQERYLDNGWYSDISYFKVLKYRSSKARVWFSSSHFQEKFQQADENSAIILYVEDGRSSASLFFFEPNPTNDTWEFAGWDTLWSTSGNVGEFMFPFYH